MFTLPILPEQIRIPLDRVLVGDVVLCEYPGVVAIAKPLDVEAASRWNDAFPDLNARSLAATRLVFDQLVAIEGLQMKSESGDPVPFDRENPIHLKSIPMEMRSAIYMGIRNRASLGEALEKNSGSPSGSDGTSGGSATTADTAASAQETS